MFLDPEMSERQRNYPSSDLEKKNQEVISDDLKFSADLINQLDLRMQQIREKIDASEDSQY